MKDYVKEWFDGLLDPDSNPSSSSLIAVLTGLTGIVMAIISIFLETGESLETSIHMSKWLIGLSLGGKGLQHVTRRKR